MCIYSALYIHTLKLQYKPKDQLCNYSTIFHRLSKSISIHFLTSLLPCSCFTVFCQLNDTITFTIILIYLNILRRCYRIPGKFPFNDWQHCWQYYLTNIVLSCSLLSYCVITVSKYHYSSSISVVVTSSWYWLSSALHVDIINVNKYPVELKTWWRIMLWLWR